MVDFKNALLEQRALLDKILAASTDPIYVLDRTGRCLYASPAGLATLERQASDVLGKDWRELNISGDGMECQDAQRESVFQTGIPIQGETRFSTVQGIKYYEYVLSPIWENDREVCAVTNTLRDISDRLRLEDERKQAEIALQEEKKLTRLATEAANLGMWFWNLAEDELVWTDRCKTLFGLAPDTQISYEIFLNALHPDDRDFIHAAVSQALEQKIEYNIEGRVVWPDGSIHWIAARGQGFYDANGQPIQMMGTAQDISERKQAEQELQSVYDSLNFALAAAEMGTWDLDLVNDIARRNLRHDQIFGYDTLQPEWGHETAKRHAHPEDLANFEEGFQQGLTTGELQFEARIIRPDQSLHWINVLGRVYYDEQRQPVRMAGVVMDITDRKQAEAKLQARETLLRLFAQHAPAGIAMFDREMRYVMTSQRWVDDYHLNSLEWLIGRSHYEVFPEVPERWRQIHQRCLAGAIEKCDEDLFIRADGTQQWIRWEVHPWHMAIGNIGGIIVFSENITQRKQVEATVLRLNQELQQKVTELQTLLDVIPIGIGIAEDPECRHIRVNPAFAKALNIPTTVNASLSAPEGERPTNFKVYQNGREMTTEELPLQYAATHGVEVRDLEVEVVWQDGTTVTLLEYAAPLLDEAQQPRGSIGAFLNITDRKRTEQALRESEERYRRLVQNFPNGAVLLFDHDLRYLLAEGQGLVELGLDLTLLEGKAICEVFGLETCQLLEPACREALAGNSQLLEISFANRIYSVHFLPIYDNQGLVKLGMAVCQDITLQKQAEQVLKTSRDQLEQQVQERTRELREANELLEQREREFRTLVENTPDVITRHDRQYRALYVNPARTRLGGFSSEFYLGKKPSDLGHPEEMARFWEASLESVFTTGEIRVDEFTLTDLDEPKSYQVYVVPERNTTGSIVSIMTIGRDITRLKQAEASARQLADELQRSNQELEQFAYVASHDLQEPLRAITSFTQMLAKRYRGQLDAKADTYIEFIVDGATRMQQLIRDLLAYSRAGRHELKLQSVDFNVLLERVKKDLRVAISESHAIITADPLPTVTADLNQMANLLQNLMGNSLKYRSEAEPQIHISVKQITTEVNQLPSQDSFPRSTTPITEWLFSIRDNGIGIEPQYAERIFGIFQRLHTSDEYSGTGLGLAICTKIIERHGGRLWVESQLSQGATFFFTIPLSIRTQNDTLH